MKRALLIATLLLSTLIIGCETSGTKAYYYVPPGESTNSNQSQITQQENSGNWNGFYNEGMGFPN